MNIAIYNNDYHKMNAKVSELDLSRARMWGEARDESREGSVVCRGRSFNSLPFCPTYHPPCLSSRPSCGTSHLSSYPTFNSSLYPSLRSPLPPWLRFLFTFWSPHCQSAQPLPRKRTKQWHTNDKSRLFVHFLSLSLSRKRTKRWLTNPGVEHWILDTPAWLPAGGKASEKNRITSGWLDNFSSVHWH